MRDEYVHDAIEPLLIEYVAGTLNADGRRNVESHIINCDPCRRALEEWQQIADAARRESPQALPPLDWQRIKGATPVILAQPRVVQPRRTSFHFVMPAAFVALMIGTAMLFAMMGGGGPSNNGNFAAPPDREQRATEVPTIEPDQTVVPEQTVVPDEPTPMPPTALPPKNIRPVNGFNLPAIPPDVSPVIVAANNIENGAVIMPHDLTIYLIDKDLLPEGSQFTLDEILYTIARVNISCGQILTLDYNVDNARDVPFAQPVMADVEGCQNIERTYRPGVLGVATDYEGRLYSNPVGQTANVLLFTRDLEKGSIITEADIALAPDYPIELVPPAAPVDPEAIVGQMLRAPVVSGQIVLESPMSSIVIMQETVDMPDDAQVGEFFDVYTQEDDPTAAIFVVNRARLTDIADGSLTLEVPFEYGAELEELASQNAPLFLVPTP